jgi:hypothetical protein
MMTAVNLAGFLHVPQKTASWMLRALRPHRQHHGQHHGSDRRTTDGVGSRGPCRSNQGAASTLWPAPSLSNMLPGVFVNAVSPGVIKTPMHSPATHEFLAGLQPMGRMG